MFNGLLNVLLVLCSIFMIFLVLIQRGKGGGLAGAFGGAGGSSAFGTKAGDIFTKVTMWTAGVWILLAMILVMRTNRGPSSAWGEESGSTTRRANLNPGARDKLAGDAGSKGGTTAAPADREPEVDAPRPGDSIPEPLPDPKDARPVNPGDPLAPLPLEPPSKAKTSP